MNCQCNTCKYSRKEITKEECISTIKEKIKGWEATSASKASEHDKLCARTDLEEANVILGEIIEDKL